LQAQLEVRAARPEAAPTQHELRVLAADAGRLGSLVDALLSLARLDAHPDLLRQPVDLDDLVFDAIRRARSLFEGRIESRGVSGAQVLGDRVALERVVQNLLDNAVRHATHTVTVNLRVVDGVAELSVADDGPGIPAPDRERVFARFTRLDSSRSRDNGGAGLGLAIVREVVAAHSGTVRIDDNAPGARVTVRLPVTGFG
jgi:signal transduction histidine kinase